VFARGVQVTPDPANRQSFWLKTIRRYRFRGRHLQFVGGCVLPVTAIRRKLPYGRQIAGSEAHKRTL
jgi:hypothetical protein